MLQQRIPSSQPNFVGYIQMGQAPVGGMKPSGNGKDKEEKVRRFI
jgi:hypothetical protein